MQTKILPGKRKINNNVANRDTKVNIVLIKNNLLQI